MRVGRDFEGRAAELALFVDAPGIMARDIETCGRPPVALRPAHGHQSHLMMIEKLVEIHIVAPFDGSANVSQSSARGGSRRYPTYGVAAAALQIPAYRAIPAPGWPNSHFRHRTFSQQV